MNAKIILTDGYTTVSCGGMSVRFKGENDSAAAQIGMLLEMLQEYPSTGSPLKSLKAMVPDLTDGIDCATWVRQQREAADARKHRRSTGACADCGRRYGEEYGFPDLIVPDAIWALISPSGDECGLLCPSCMCRRAHEGGIRCRATFKSGPFREND